MAEMTTKAKAPAPAPATEEEQRHALGMTRAAKLMNISLEEAMRTYAKYAESDPGAAQEKLDALADMTPVAFDRRLATAQKTRVLAEKSTSTKKNISQPETTKKARDDDPGLGR